MINCEPMVGGVHWSQFNWEIPAYTSKCCHSLRATRVTIFCISLAMEGSIFQ